MTEIERILARRKAAAIPRRRPPVWPVYAAAALVLLASIFLPALFLRLTEHRPMSTFAQATGWFVLAAGVAIAARHACRRLFGPREYDGDPHESLSPSGYMDHHTNRQHAARRARDTAADGGPGWDWQPSESRE